MANRVWSVPASRMKARRDHAVPLALQAVDVLERARALHCDASLLFPGSGRNGKTQPISQGSISDALRKLGRFDAQGRRITLHGFRSTFRVWTMEQAQTSREAAEAALAHVESDRTVAADTMSALTSSTCGSN